METEEKGQVKAVLRTFTLLEQIGKNPSMGLFRALTGDGNSQSDGIPVHPDPEGSGLCAVPARG